MRCNVRLAPLPAVSSLVRLKAAWSTAVRLTAAMALVSCSAPADLPLPTRPALVESLDGLDHEGTSLRPKLTVSQVALLAVRNTPDLRAARAQHDVAP